MSSATGDRLRLGMPPGKDVASDLAAAAAAAAAAESAGLSGVWISIVGEGKAWVELAEIRRQRIGTGTRQVSYCSRSATQGLLTAAGGERECTLDMEDMHRDSGSRQINYGDSERYRDDEGG